MTRAKINAKDVLNDIRSGMDDASLMEKYQLSVNLLHDLFGKLVQAGVLEQSEVDNRAPLFEGTVEVVFRFPVIDEVRAKELGDQLIQAAKKGVLTEVRRLLDRGAAVDSRGTWGMTPLMWAASKGHEAVVRFLLDRGADVNASASNSSTALMWTAFSGHAHLAAVLVERGAHVDAQSNCGRTALISAAFNGHEDMVNLLMNRGADPEIKDQEGREALTYAIGRGHSRVAEALRRGRRQ
jgi:ankyrin repeat protein